ncbi:MAG TPA: hypothetical protein VG407_11395 [Caulobacteraceae bacterium]|jgi:hypothetical protein|nr:hypothetical protein [Caulobacteraceae bacterium]
MSDADTATRTLDAYLRQVRHGLRGLPDAEATEIVEELRSHALDRAGGALSGQSVDATIAGLGPARELAGMYLAERMAERVEVSRSPLLILKTVWRLAGLSLRACTVFIVSLIGYLLAASFFIIALAKPFLPKRTGLWIWNERGDWDFSLGIQWPHGHELLGWWIIPICLALSMLCLYLTWRFGLTTVRRLGRSRSDTLATRG